MIKTTLIATAVLVGFSLSNCSPNEQKKQDKPTTAKEACSSPMSAADSAKAMSTQIEIKGEVEHPLVLTVDSLKQMKVVDITDLKVVCQNGMAPKLGKSGKGVLLKDLLDKAKIIQKGHKDRNFYIVARATDNYMATFSWAELFNSNTGDSTFVMFEENGQPIKNTGNFVLNCTSDIKTGIRHVRWLKSIEVYRVN
ncbi:MAG: molybdopterin-dependent oxidoreductase [Bacteroidota bacterium]